MRGRVTQKSATPLTWSWRYDTLALEATTCGTLLSTARRPQYILCQGSSGKAISPTKDRIRLTTYLTCYPTPVFCGRRQGKDHMHEARTWTRTLINDEKLKSLALSRCTIWISCTICRTQIPEVCNSRNGLHDRKRNT